MICVPLLSTEARPGKPLWKTLLVTGKYIDCITGTTPVQPYSFIKIFSFHKLKQNVIIAEPC